jgi:RNA polymerase sigma-70 factor (ECF subfamily)
LDDHARSLLNASMRRLADGDRAAFDPVYAALWPAISAFCGRMLGVHADAEDAAQQTLLKIFNQTSTFDPSRDALTWALAIAAWECRTLRRRAVRAREVAGEEGDSLPSGAPSPEDGAIARDLTAALRVVLGTLSEQDRETLHGPRMEDRSPVPAVPAATFRKRRERAVARLREVWRRVYGA